MSLALTRLQLPSSLIGGTAAFLKWLAKIIVTLTFLWLILFGYLDATLGEFFGPPNWTAILLVAVAGWLIAFVLSSVAKRILIADQSAGRAPHINTRS